MNAENADIGRFFGKIVKKLRLSALFSVPKAKCKVKNKLSYDRRQSRTFPSCQTIWVTPA